MAIKLNAKAVSKKASPRRLVKTVKNAAFKDLGLKKNITRRKELSPSPSQPKNILTKLGLKINRYIDPTKVNRTK